MVDVISTVTHELVTAHATKITICKLAFLVSITIATMIMVAVIRFVLQMLVYAHASADMSLKQTERHVLTLNLRQSHVLLMFACSGQMVL